MPRAYWDWEEMLKANESGFYPYTPPHLRELGLQHTSAWMTFGQVTEIIK